MKHKVLYLCTGNSCRPQMAEATPALRAGASVVNARLGDAREIPELLKPFGSTFQVGQARNALSNAYTFR